MFSLSFQKCTLNNCPVEIKFKVDNIIKEGLREDIKNSSIKAEDGVDNTFAEKENHKDNNVSTYINIQKQPYIQFELILRIIFFHVLDLTMLCIKCIYVTVWTEIHSIQN